MSVAIENKKKQNNATGEITAIFFVWLSYMLLSPGIHVTASVLLLYMYFLAAVLIR